jgi:phage terminase large subunit-like protein
VLDDASGIYSPAQWAARAIELYDRWDADFIVGEVNNGGDLVERNVHVERDDPPPFRAVHASRGKQVRADPISALYEQGRVHHLGCLGKLEDQMCAWDPANDADSPDRVDALVWGISFLDLNKQTKAYEGIARGNKTSRGR